MNTLQLSYGNELTTGKPTASITLKALHERIVSGSNGLASDTRRLREVALVDQGAYRKLKTRLPYFCGSLFKDGIRKLEHFSHAAAVIFDLDKLPEGEITRLVPALKNEPLVKMFYTSPSGQGIKILVILKKEITDPSHFRAVYLTIARQLGEKFNCMKYIDRLTHDATRVSFLSHDPNAYLNESATAFNWEKPCDEGFIEQGADVTEGSLKQNTNLKQSDITAETFKEMADVLRKKTNQGVKNFYVPSEVKEIAERLSNRLPDRDLKLKEQKSIHYGIKYRVEHRTGAEGEINIYYGKRGYSFIPSPRAGADYALGELLAELCREIVSFKPRMIVVK